MRDLERFYAEFIKSDCLTVEQKAYSFNEKTKDDLIEVLKIIIEEAHDDFTPGTSIDTPEFQKKITKKINRYFELRKA